MASLPKLTYVTRLTVERRIAAPPAAVFDWLTDVSNYVQTRTVIRARRTKDGEGALYGVGAIREVTAVGAWFRESITHYDRPNEFRYLIVKSVPAIEHRGGSVQLTPVENGTHVTWTTEYELPLRSGGALVATAIAPILERSFRSILAAADRSLTRR